ncbi:hypothetical protein GCM10010404_81350 [Nonomuraea africana]|uniref:Ser/Thr protein kinase RdoA (MazF antagonist) n=1 Tax=Nonomuraea africana TaxID=46171 RepID=A0ABR9KY55_9ACTN|nr:phosphotransferase [Nonomuraea africana]MBE1566487.1 Ser/Thr protein kinase RdoA (MazF antagonist) [Nonomuraea africana]
MTPGVFTKRYPSSQAASQAAAHHAWLAEHAQPFRLPPILAVHASRIDFGFVDGRHAQVGDTLTVAAALGRAHAAAWASDLHHARLNTPRPLASGLDLADFVTPRLAALNRRQQTGHATAQQVVALLPLLSPHPAAPVAFYKDTNPRNVLIGARGEPVVIDLDDLTLAPFGYDLAKLLLTLAMSHGRLPTGTFTAALASYNQPLTAADLTPVTLAQLLDYAELHHLLTLPYLGRGGYRYPWPAVRPASEDLL